MQFGVYVPGQPWNDAGLAVKEMLREEKPGAIHTDTMRLRIGGGLVDLCTDTYFVAHDQGVAYSRLWYGWGKGRERAVGNFGNFLTLEQVRGQGIGRKMLELWYEDLNARSDKPLALFCSAKEQAAKLYFPYGFRTAIKGAVEGPLFMPLRDKSWDFDAFCDMYYQPADYLLSRPATFAWRHEIDCLLYFSLRVRGESFGIGEVIRLEQALLYFPERAKLFFTPDERCVGWAVDDVAQIHPAYRHLRVEREEA